MAWSVRLKLNYALATCNTLNCHSLLSCLALMAMAMAVAGWRERSSDSIFAYPQQPSTKGYIQAPVPTCFDLVAEDGVLSPNILALKYHSDKKTVVLM